MTISNEAVEAAVKAWDHHWGDRYGDEAVEEMGEEVRVALEAAAPFIRAQALKETAEMVYVDGGLVNAAWLRARAAILRADS